MFKIKTLKELLIEGHIPCNENCYAFLVKKEDYPKIEKNSKIDIWVIIKYGGKVFPENSPILSLLPKWVKKRE